MLLFDIIKMSYLGQGNAGICLRLNSCWVLKLERKRMSDWTSKQLFFFLVLLPDYQTSEPAGCLLVLWFQSFYFVEEMTTKKNALEMSVLACSFWVLVKLYWSAFGHFVPFSSMQSMCICWACYVHGQDIIVGTMQITPNGEHRQSLRF